MDISPVHTIPSVGKKHDADYVFYELTRSICPDCRRVIDAHILLRENKVYMRKRCPEHGQFEALVYGDARAYTSAAKFNKPGTIPLAFDLKGALEGLWSSSSVAGSEKATQQFALSCAACGLADGFDVSTFARHIFMIMLQDFMDPWTFNQKNLMKCCKEILLPDGKQIPFCAYNSVGYREQAREQLAARERARNRARRDGTAFTPLPLTFMFDQPVGQARPVNGSKRQRINRRARARENG